MMLEKYSDSKIPFFVYFRSIPVLFLLEITMNDAIPGSISLRARQFTQLFVSGAGEIIAYII